MMTAPYYTDEHGSILLGDCLDVLPTIADETVDAVITDPPYGIGFMGHEWDQPGQYGALRAGPRAEPAHPRSRERGDANSAAMAGRYDLSRSANARFGAWCEAWARECLRVLKPGGHIIAFGGARTWHRLQTGIEDAGFEIRDSIAWLFGSGFPKSLNLTAEHDGWGTALKPAFEPIVVGRKPLAGTVAANMAQHGTGALHIDACRVATTDVLTGSGTPPLRFGGDNARPFHETAEPRGVTQHAGGRWPTNVVLDTTTAADLDRETGILSSGILAAHHARAPKDAGILGAYGSVEGERGYGDSGGASRFFPTFHYEAKAPTAERPRGVDGTAHPTVKPLDLMRWVVRLVAPVGATVLDPFLGSGTTAEACVIEGMRFIGIERHEPYALLSIARLSKPIQRDIFGGVA